MTFPKCRITAEVNKRLGWVNVEHRVRYSFWNGLVVGAVGRGGGILVYYYLCLFLIFLISPQIMDILIKP